MNKQKRFHEFNAKIVVLKIVASMSLLAASAAPGAAPPQISPANLREMDGQQVSGEENLLWKYAEVVVEWGFKKGTENLSFDGEIQSSYLLGMLGTAKPLPGDNRTTMTGPLAWKSAGGGTMRRGLIVPILYTTAIRGPARTIVTIRTSSGSFSFQPIDLETGPILAPEYGFFVCSIPIPVSTSAIQKTPAASGGDRIAPPDHLLRTKMDARDGSTFVNGWGSAGTPSVLAHPGVESGTLLHGLIELPPHSIAVHPGPGCDIAIGWRSPIAGKVNIHAKVAHAHPSGGNGIEWSIVHDNEAGRNVLACGAMDRGGVATFPSDAEANTLTAVVVKPGDLLSLVVGNRGEHSCDTTSTELTITEIGDKPNTWDLARDVVEDIQAGNPHADSLGNADIWYFYAPPQATAWHPVVMPFQSKATTASEYITELTAHNLKTIRQQVRQRPEQTWEGAMRALYGDMQLPPIPEPPFEPAMSVEVPDKHLTALWRLGAWRIIRRCPRIDRADLAKVGAAGDVTQDCRIVDGEDPQGIYVVRDNPFPPLGCETDRILWALDHQGMHQVAADGISIWLENQQPDGCLSLNSGIEQGHQVGALQILWVMAEHYLLTGDKEWLKKESPRLKAAVDWILQRRKTTMKTDLAQNEIDGIKVGTWSPYGLQPKVSMGDGDPTGSRYYYWADAFGYRSVKLFADIIADIDPKMSADYAEEAAKYRKDILPVLEESIVLSPVVRVRDGTSRSFHPQGFQDRGPLAEALPMGVNIYTHCGPYHGDYCITSAAIEAWLRAGLLSVDDVRIDGHFHVLEDAFLLDHPWVRRRKADYDPEKDWFGFGWSYQSGWERLPEYYLLKDDIPNFHRSWLNRCAVDINLNDYSFNEHTTFAPNDKSHGNAVFLSNFRNMLVMEIGDSLWLGRAVPRVWLAQGNKISVRNSPTHFGTVAYEIVSDVENNRIIATVDIPSRKAPKEILLRLRHPKTSPIKSVTIDGKESKEFDVAREVVRLRNFTSKVAVTVNY
ncbi:MAG: hypothetical protein JW829_04960 [Pirellulales bacterium]|nr:hypothetical protein [Pirellulales bacterium]